MTAYISALAAHAARANDHDSREYLLGIFDEWLGQQPVATAGALNCILVGGSIAKGASHPTSDVDATFIVENVDNLAIANVNQLTSSTIYCREVRINLRVLGMDQVHEAATLFASGQDISVSNQDLMWNLRFGIYVDRKPSASVRLIEDAWDPTKDTVAKAQIRNRLTAMIAAIRAEISYANNDPLHRLELILRAQKVSLLVGYYIVGEGFWGYKNTNYIMGALPPTCVDCIRYGRDLAANGEVAMAHLVSSLSDLAATIAVSDHV